MKHDAAFYGFMQAYDDDSAPEGAWFAILESAGEEWLKMHPEKGKDGNDLAHRYLRMAKARGDA